MMVITSTKIDNYSLVTAEHLNSLHLAHLSGMSNFFRYANRSTSVDEVQRKLSGCRCWCCYWEFFLSLFVFWSWFVVLVLVVDSLRLTYFNIRQLISDDGRVNIDTIAVLVDAKREIIVFNWICSARANERARCYLSLSSLLRCSSAAYFLPCVNCWLKNAEKIRRRWWW